LQFILVLGIFAYANSKVLEKVIVRWVRAPIFQARQPHIRLKTQSGISITHLLALFRLPGSDLYNVSDFGQGPTAQQYL
jgi:hypothetical protein